MKCSQAWSSNIVKYSQRFFAIVNILKWVNFVKKYRNFVEWQNCELNIGMVVVTVTETSDGTYRTVFFVLYNLISHLGKPLPVADIGNVDSPERSKEF